jgi:hypothetical protein
MPRQETVARQILEMVRANPECTLEELTLGLVEFHWSDVFLEVDHLCRSGQLRLKQGSHGLTTTLRVP